MRVNLKLRKLLEAGASQCEQIYFSFSVLPPLSPLSPLSSLSPLSLLKTICATLGCTLLKLGERSLLLLNAAWCESISAIQEMLPIYK
jgi:hypothetical protein